MKIKLDKLEDLTRKAILKYGYDKEETQTILDMLMYAQLRGNNQGIVLLIGKGLPKNKNVKSPTVEKESPTTALIDANKTMEAVVLKQAVNMVVKKAKDMGIAIVGIHNSDGASGAIGYWSRIIANHGLVGITMSSYATPRIAPYGSSKGLFCTNPIAWGIPTEDEPIVFDMSSAAITHYGLVEAKTAGGKLQKPLGYDKDGNESTDPESILGGATKPFDLGFKGSGIAMMVQILGGSLVGGDFGKKGGDEGDVVIAINPDFFIGINAFREEISKMKEAVKSSQKLPGFDEIMVPGERGDNIRKKILENGEIEVEDNLFNELQKFVKGE